MIIENTAPSAVSLPSFAAPVSQLLSTAQFVEPVFKKWACEELGWQFGFNRKLWEYAFILNALSVHGKLAGRGLGFGVGREPIVPVMLKHGARLVVSDLADEQAQAEGWATMQFDTAANDALSFSYIDMNVIPPELTGFDFLWSCGSLEHIGGLANGLRFVEHAMACLKPGGIAVHTTEFTLTSNDQTYESPGLSFYRQRDLEQLAQRLRAQGHQITLNLNRGQHLLDQTACDEATPWELSINESLCGHVITSVGLIIRKG